MLSRIDTKVPLLQTLCIVHSRELAIQNFEVCVKLGKGMVSQGLNCTLAIPGRYPPQPWNSQLCVGTPGALLDKWINSQKRHPMNKFLEYFKVLVVDEADEFLSKQNYNQGRGRGRGRSNHRFSGGLYDHLTRIIQEIRCNVHQSYQTLLFSATFPRTIYALALKLAPDAIEISLSKKDVALNNILVLTMPCSNHMEKFENLKMIIALANIGQMIVFTNTIKIAQYIVQAMHAKEVEIPCSVLYGSGMQPHLRDATMSNFRNGETVCLVASNVIARGIDVPAVGLVVNFEIPFDAETFMHRVGRCGRFGTRGVCLNFVLAPEQMTGGQRYGYNSEQNYNNMQANEEMRKFDEIAKDYNVNVQHFKQNELEVVSKVIQQWLEPFRKF